MKFVTFQIFPDHSKKWYWTVNLFRSKSSMYRYSRLLSKYGGGRNRGLMEPYAAITSSFNSTEAGKKRQFGEILFCPGSMRKSGIVSHEMCHAVTYWWKVMERMPWRDISEKSSGKADERHAYLLGAMVAQYWRGYYNALDKKQIR